jgi:hypothetical protein
MPVYLARFEAYVVAPNRATAWQASEKWGVKHTEGEMWLQSLSLAQRGDSPLNECDIVPLIKVQIPGAQITTDELTKPQKMLCKTHGEVFAELKGMDVPVCPLCKATCSEIKVGDVNEVKKEKKKRR